MKGTIQAASNDKANLETMMTEELDRLSSMSPSRCIFRVPDRLRRVRKEDYTPRVISIGPLHHGEEALKAMEEHKKRYLQYFLRRRTNNLVQNFQHNLSLKDCIKKIQDKEPELRSQYSETIDLESDEFVRIILVDAIFMIEFLFRWPLRRCELANENDCIFGVPRMAFDIRLDLVMLENQLPFFILKDLFNELNGVDERLLLDLSRNILDGGSSTFRGILLDNLGTINLSEVKHFVDLLRKLCIAPIILKKQSEEQSKPTAVNQSLCLSFHLCPKKEENPYKDATTPSISKLHLAGVKFKVRSTGNLFDINFVNRILEIPELKIEDFTELILRNLIVFEQCTFDHYISDYVTIMDEFLDTSKDVEFLVKYGIVENSLGGGDEELSTMINSLSTGAYYDSKNFCYGTLCKDLNKFCSSKCNERIANLRQKYFNTPW